MTITYIIMVHVKTLLDTRRARFDGSFNIIYRIPEGFCAIHKKHAYEEAVTWGKKEPE